MTPNELLLLRREAGLTQQELGERIGYSRQAVINWERKTYRIPDDAVRAITEACTKHIPKPATATERKDALEALDAYRKCRAIWSHARTMQHFQEQNFVPSPMAMEMIRNAYPDIINNGE